MKKVSTVLAFAILVVIVVAAIYALTGFIIMLVGNVILEWLNHRTLDYRTAVAFAVLLSVVGGAFRANVNRKTKDEQ